MNEPLLSEIDCGGGVAELHLVVLWETAEPEAIEPVGTAPLQVDRFPLWRTPIEDLAPASQWTTGVGSGTHAAGERLQIWYLDLPADLPGTISAWLDACMQAGATLAAFVLEQGAHAPTSELLEHWWPEFVYATAWRGAIELAIDDDVRAGRAWDRHVASTRDMRLPPLGLAVPDAAMDPELLGPAPRPAIDVMQIMPTLLEVCPSFQTRWDEIEIANRESPGAMNGEVPGMIRARLHYSDAGAFATHLAGLLRGGRLKELPAVGHALERLLRDGDGDTQNIVVVGLLESMQNIMLSDRTGESTLVPYLGQVSRSAWRGLNRFWTGRPEL